MFVAAACAFRRPLVPAAVRVVAALLGVLVRGAVVLAEPVPLQALCEVHFTGTSTLHDFHGTTPTLTVAVPAGAVAGHWKAEAVTQVRTMRTGNSNRDSNMWAMFDAPHWPQIRATFADIDAASVAASKRLPFQLTIRDVTRDVVATVTSWQQDSDKVVFDADFDVSLSAFGLEAPSVLGLIRVADIVAAGVHVVVTKTPRSP